MIWNVLESLSLRVFAFASPLLFVLVAQKACEADAQLERLEMSTAQLRCALHPETFDVWSEYDLGSGWARRVCEDPELALRYTLIVKPGLRDDFGVSWSKQKAKGVAHARAEPYAPDAVRIAIAETGAAAWRIGSTRILAQPGVEPLRGFRANETLDVLLGPDSLATAGVCDAWRNGAECPDTDAQWRDSGNAAQYLCRGRGAGFSRVRGHRVIDGAHISYRFASTESCPGQHNGCAVIITMTRAQYYVLRAVARDDDPAYPAGLKAIIDAMRADPRRTNRLADVPACIRGVSVRAGRSDLNPPAAED